MGISTNVLSRWKRQLTADSQTADAVDLFGFGHCCADYLTLLDPFPAKGKKGDVVASSIIGGGPVPTACQTVAKFGRSARFCGKVGDDADGRIVRQGLVETGVDGSFVLVDPEVATARAYIWVDARDGSRTVALDISRFRFPAPDELDPRLPAACRFFLADGRAAGATLKALRIARASGVPTMLDAGAVRPRFAEMLPLVDYAVVSRDLADTLAPGASPEELVLRLLDGGAQRAVVTVGEKGAVWRDGSGNGFVPGFPVKPLDTTGAGDVFHGALIHGLLDRWALEQAIRFANAAAALSTRKLSGRLGIPELGEVMGMVR